MGYTFTGSFRACVRARTEADFFRRLRVLLLREGWTVGTERCFIACIERRGWRYAASARGDTRPLSTASICEWQSATV